MSYTYTDQTLKEFALQYFYHFSKKELDGVVDLFDDSIMLEDWENKAYTKEDVIAVYQKIFDSVNSISVTPMKIFADGGVVIAQLLIRINGVENIYVVDIIHYDTETGKIKSIQAFKG